MGQTKTKVIETAIEPEKAEKMERELHSFDDSTGRRISRLEEYDKAVDPENGEKPKNPPAGGPKKGKARYRSLRYKSLVNQIDKSKEYTLDEAIELIKKTAKAKFETSIEAHVNLGFSPEKTDQIIRTTITLPNAAGKKLRILVFSDKDVTELKKLGAEVGSESTLKEIESGKINFDKLIAEPAWMPKLAKTAKVLGPKGLMPNPKSGTVTENPLNTVKEFSQGKQDLKTEKMPVVHINVGKTGLENEKIKENIVELVKTIQNNRPEGFKKELIKSVYLSSTMGPSVRVNLSSILTS